MTHTHETFGDHVEQEAADEFVGIEGHGLFSVLIFSVPVPPEADQPLAEPKGNFSAIG